MVTQFLGLLRTMVSIVKKPDTAGVVDEALVHANKTNCTYR